MTFPKDLKRTTQKLPKSSSRELQNNKNWDGISILAYTLDVKKHKGAMSSIFPSKTIIFTEEKAKGKAIFRYPRTQSVLKELLKVLLQKPKTISIKSKSK